MRAGAAGSIHENGGKEAGPRGSYTLTHGPRGAAPAPSPGPGVPRGPPRGLSAPLGTRPRSRPAPAAPPGRLRLRPTWGVGTGSPRAGAGDTGQGGAKLRPRRLPEPWGKHHTEGPGQCGEPGTAQPLRGPLGLGSGGGRRADGQQRPHPARRCGARVTLGRAGAGRGPGFVQQGAKPGRGRSLGGERGRPARPWGAPVAALPASTGAGKHLPCSAWAREGSRHRRSPGAWELAAPGPPGLGPGTPWRGGGSAAGTRPSCSGQSLLLAARSRLPLDLHCARKGMRARSPGRGGGGRGPAERPVPLSERGRGDAVQPGWRAWTHGTHELPQPGRLQKPLCPPTPMPLSRQTPVKAINSLFKEPTTLLNIISK